MIKEFLIKKWKQAFSMEDIPTELQYEYAKELEEAAKKLIAKYGGTKKEAPNIWPELKRDFFKKYKIGDIVQR